MNRGRQCKKAGLTCLQLLTAIVMLMAGIFLHAQEYRGTISGVVTDPIGAVIPNATVTASGPQQNYKSITNANGEYVIPFVQLGTYRVTAEASGFGSLSQNNIRIDVDSKINLNFKLQIGNASESITVSGNDVGINTSDASVGTVMDPDKVQNLPLNGRQVYSLLSLVPGVKTTRRPAHLRQMA